ncbi:MAG: hypothetical protein NUW06_07400 [Candidatus Acetothermia bacterium]|jgi:hypothetical protein|nr:hypothetical protein [Candidatus Acetothermia bacterium]MDH7506048.1 hypothetical protein [Candidatus Acetothermia bacterium]
MRRITAVALIFTLFPSLVAPLAGAAGLGVGMKATLFPWREFGLESAFVHLRMSDFLGVEGLTAILEGGLGLDLRTVSLDTKLLLTRFALDSGAITPFTGGGLSLGLELAEGALRLIPIPEGLAGVEYSLPPLLLLGEIRVQSQVEGRGGMVILLGVAVEF